MRKRKPFYCEPQYRAFKNWKQQGKRDTTGLLDVYQEEDWEQRYDHTIKPT
jgi:hypothetical protein